VEPKGSCLLWAAETITAIPLRTIGIGYNWFVMHCENTAGIRTRHDKVILLHDNTRPHVAKVVKKYLEILEWDVFIAPSVVFSGYCSFWFLIVPKEITGSLLSQKSKIGSKIGSLPKTSHFSRWNSKIAWEMEKSSRQRWTIL